MTIAKAIVIILMVVGHSGCPKELEKCIYSFHVPFFFVCSGFFFSPPLTFEKLKHFWLRKFKGLYFPYVKWCLPFVLLHNVFFRLNLYNGEYGYNGWGSHWYSAKDFVHAIINVVLKMDYPPQLLGGFWFLKYLLIATLFVSFLTYILRHWREDNQQKMIVLGSLLGFSIIFSYFEVSLLLFSLKDLLWCSVFYYSGYMLKGIEISKVKLICCMVVFVSVNVWQDFPALLVVKGFIPMLQLYATSIAGALLVFQLSKWLDKHSRLVSPLYYVGNHTLEILALHFLAFNIVDLYLIEKFQLSISHLAEFPVMAGFPHYWMHYTVVGVTISLIICWLYERLRAFFTFPTP